MKIEEFNKEMNENLKELDIELSEKQLKQFYDYMNILIEWNKVMNLTNITEPSEIIQKHFIDSLTVLKHIKEDDSIIDVGTGAGFPGIPIKIVYPKTKVTLLDSLNKRVKFLNEVISELELKDIKTIHGRAEEIAHDGNYREKYNIAIARAVAKRIFVAICKNRRICNWNEGNKRKRRSNRSKECNKNPRRRNN